MGFAVREIATEPYGSSRPAIRVPATRTTSFDDVVEDLGDEIATLAAHIHAATYRFLEMIARFDRLGGWEPGGHRSCACWLAFRTGLDAGTAREHVRVARALEGLPETSAAMSRGELSFSQVRALTRVAEPETEADLLELAVGCTVAQLERVVRAYRLGSRQDEADRERQRHLDRTLAVFPDVDGMYVVKGRLEPEVGALLMRAVEAASDALYRENRRVAVASDADAADADDSAGASGREAARRRADALGLLAERALAAGFGADDDAPVSGTKAERYQVLLHVEAATLAAEGEPGRSELEDGTRVSAETSRRLCCDAGVVRVEETKDGTVLDVGRRKRTIPPAIRRALEVRDRGCRFPGCGLRFTDAHHIVHWADGGETGLENTVLLCRFHHRMVHEGGWGVESWGKGRVAFRDRGGALHYEGGWTSGETPGGPRGSAASLVESNRAHGVEPDGWTASARWSWRSRVPAEVLARVGEAVL